MENELEFDDPGMPLVEEERPELNDMTNSLFLFASFAFVVKELFLPLRLKPVAK